MQPLKEALHQAKHSRNCPGLDDISHLLSGVGRVLNRFKSGRDWIQNAQSLYDLENLSVSRTFEALKSPRRESLVREVARNITQQLDRANSAVDDPLAAHPELKGYEVFASDGHVHSCSAHEHLTMGKKRPPTHLFSLNIRSHALSYLGDCVADEGKKKKHEISALKQMQAKELRMGAGKAVKTIHLYDPAIIDYKTWNHWKSTSAVYIITREKSNSALITVGKPQWDTQDPRNNGVLNDEWVGSSSLPETLRRITYQDPSTAEIFKFITNVMTLPPGLLAWLYCCRWDVEAVFSEAKNHLEENKAWARSREAKRQQAHFICMAHNLMIMLEKTLKKEHKIEDTKTKNKQQKRDDEKRKLIKDKGGKANQLYLDRKRRAKRSLQFIRWLRCEWVKKRPWGEALKLLRPLAEHYLK